MQTIQQKLADRIYELLPEKKELKFGCEVSVYIPQYGEPYEGSEYSEAKVGIATYIEPSEPMTFLDGSHLYDVYASDFTNGDTEYVDSEDGIICEIIGSPIRLADVLKALNIKYKKDIFGYMELLLCGNDVVKITYKEKEAEYNLSQDNILNQSDEFCEFVYNLIK